ncbi:hypothetical protein [Rhizobium ruizarguesonis]|uniref:hypothetical protein n=1 Tax=Rhizobium ruizarguesonis TaxID=2081791 RepID=UPI00103167C4|nr:hypothetical protein [Rhizobium ruizarguesonis]TBD81064.1 hypothetical protein ELH11_14790 [Rhizobium ruizarguesonis]TBE12225.1 hypothetical protein ELH09_14870 [Rhizobium ruizarguesonis]WSH32206.1 hypothetical protein U8P70_16795 [Rhizobium ruizarguesonis]
MTDGCFDARLPHAKERALYDLMSERPGLPSACVAMSDDGSIEMTRFQTNCNHRHHYRAVFSEAL